MKTERLRMLREARGWSQRELSWCCNFAENMIGKYESGQAEPTATNLKTIYDLLNISSDYLLGINDHPDRHVAPNDLSSEETQIIQTY